MEHYDIAVIGGGIAGASLARELAEEFEVCVLEAEAELGNHTTGRSAATWMAGYGPPEVRRLTLESQAFLDDPPFAVDGPLLTPLACLYVGLKGDEKAAAELADEIGAQRIEPSEAERINPILRPGRAPVAVIDSTSCAVDVHGLHQAYVRDFRKRGGIVRRTSRVVEAHRDGRSWTMKTAVGNTIRAGFVVVAAGAWSDGVASLFGSRGQGLVSRRRTMFGSPTTASLAGVPFTCDIAGGWYIQAEGDLVLGSPKDSTEHVPGDPRPDELEIARAIEAINEATVLGLRSVRTSWAGLRTFSPNGEPVVGFDNDVPGLFWFAGQGGYGIQMAPALALLGADRVKSGIQ